MRLPDWPVGNIKREKEMVSTRGVNYSDNIQDGDLAVCENLSARRWPYIATRNKRAREDGLSGVTALTSWNGLVAVSGTDLIYQGDVVGQVTPGDKQFAAVNTRLVIWPDKVYLDLNDRTVKPLEARVTATRAVFAEDGKTVTLTGTEDLTGLFRPGDGVFLDGCTGELAGNNKSFVIAAVTADSVTALAGTIAAVFTPGTEPAEEETVGESSEVESEPAAVTLTRKLPDMDFICESGNRLWGCSNQDKTIYISALGTPENFYVSGTGSTDSFAFNVATEGDFTGCCKLSSSVLFFKEHVLHKVLGDYPAEYYAYTYELEGLRAGCHKSLVIINDVLHYVGPHGVFTYAGGSPTDISYLFGDHEITEAAGGTDGERYWLACLDNGNPALFVYSPQENVWFREDSVRVKDMARMGKDVYLLRADGTVWLEDAGEDDPDVDWQMEYTPFYETLEGRKRVSRLLLRAELPKGAWLRAQTVTDKGRWEDAGIIQGPRADTVPMVVQPNRGDVYRVRLEGHGPCVIKGVLREFIAGGYG